MSNAQLRMLFAGVFAIVALVAGVVLQIYAGSTPEWLIATVAASVGYIFGHAQENGIVKRK